MLESFNAVLCYSGVMSKSAVKSTKDIMGGAPVFEGTRVPVQTLIDYLEGGDSIDQFLEDFPTVSRDQVITFLEAVKSQLPEFVA